MVSVMLICSEEACAELFVAEGELAELETLVCECGCGLQVLRVSEAPGAEPGTLTLEPVG